MPTSRDHKTIPLGFEVGTGKAVEIPLAHTFVTGQTQLSGKTTTLRAIVERSGQRALAFVTKRGEEFEGRRIQAYLPREGETPIHWRLVETILASALGQRQLKYERLWIINAAKGARSLADVRKNVERLQAKAKGNSADAYMLIGEYIDLVLPEMRALAAADSLDLRAGLNVMDLAGVGPQLQALVIRAALERINHHEEGVLTVFPEAWEFAPRGRAAPAKDEAIAMVRKGAVLRNFLLCDSQDIAGVDTVVRQGASVWILGVQRELNELKRTLQTIPAGVRRPKPEDVATLELGQFYACWGPHAIKTYVQPMWMSQDLAAKVARGELDAQNAASLASGHNVMKAFRHVFESPVREEQVTKDEAARLTRENDQLKADNADLKRRLEALEKGPHGDGGTQMDRGRGRAPGQHGADRAAAHKAASEGDRSTDRASAPISGAERAASNGFDHEALYQDIKARLIDEAAEDAKILKVLVNRPELQMDIVRQIIEVSEDSTRGLVARLIADGFFENGQSSAATLKELSRRGRSLLPATLYPELDKLAEMGFFRIEDGKDDRGRPRKEYHLVPGMKVNVHER